MLLGKRIAILVEEGFEDAELTEPMRAMKDAEARVTIIGNGVKETYHGKRGTVVVNAEMSADEAWADDYDAIIIPGGLAPDRMRLHRSMVDLVKSANDKGILIAAVCHGPQLLISAGIVKGRRVTSWPSVEIDLRNAGADWVDEPVVRDGNIITARRPVDLPKFNKAIIKALLN